MVGHLSCDGLHAHTLCLMSDAHDGWNTRNLPDVTYGSVAIPATEVMARTIHRDLLYLASVGHRLGLVRIFVTFAWHLLHIGCANYS